MIIKGITVSVVLIHNLVTIITDSGSVNHLSLIVKIFFTDVSFLASMAFATREVCIEAKVQKLVSISLRVG